MLVLNKLVRSARDCTHYIIFFSSCNRSPHLIYSPNLSSTYLLVVIFLINNVRIREMKRGEMWKKKGVFKKSDYHKRLFKQNCY